MYKIDPQLVLSIYQKKYFHTASKNCKPVIRVRCLTLQQGAEMNDSREITEKGTQFVLSYELLALLRWLVEHDADRLRKIIGKAVASGLQEELHKIEHRDEQSLNEEVQHSITDFLGLLESLLLEVVSEHVKHRARHQNLMPALDQIDSTICDDTTVRCSLEKATAKIDHNPDADPKDLLFEELLKRWKPTNKHVKN